MADFTEQTEKYQSDFTELTVQQERALSSLPQALAELEITRHELTREEQLSFLKVRNWNPVSAAAQIKESLKWRQEIGHITIDQVAPFMRAPPGGQRGPDGCLVLLEDMQGGCARDTRGRPIVLSIGMSHGTAREMQLQMVYMMQRARCYALPGQCPGNTCTVIEVAPCDGAVATFRFPDKDVRTLFDLQTNVFPSSLGSTTHFCGLPRAVTWAFRLCKPFMSTEAYENMKLKPSFDHLIDKHVPVGSLLPRWAPGAGTFDFDLDRYVEWRAAEEGVPLEKLCKQGEGRTFNTNAAVGALPEDAAASVSATDLLSSDDGVKRWGVVSKRGSGRGIFGNRKWKEKLVVLQAGALIYFDSTNHTDATNFASKTISLGGKCQVRRSEPEGLGLRGPGAEFTLISPSRDYVFGCAPKDADDWVASVQAEIDAAFEQSPESK